MRSKNSELMGSNWGDKSFLNYKKETKTLRRYRRHMTRLQIIGILQKQSITLTIISIT